MNDFLVFLNTLSGPVGATITIDLTPTIQPFRRHSDYITSRHPPLKNLSLPPVAVRAELFTGTSSLVPLLLLLPFTPCLLSTSSVILVHVVRVVFVPSCICISCLTAHTSRERHFSPNLLAMSHRDWGSTSHQTLANSDRHTIYPSKSSS